MLRKLLLAAIAAAALAAPTVALAVDWSAHTDAPTSVTNHSATLGASGSCLTTCQFVFHYRKVGAGTWTVDGSLATPCPTFPCSWGTGDPVSGLASHTSYEYQVGIKADGNEIQWVGSDGTSATTQQFTTLS